MLSKEEIRSKYREERDKRLRSDGNDQYYTLEGQLSYYKNDPYVSLQKRAPKKDHVLFAYIGGGFAGLCAGAGLVEAGTDAKDIRIVEKGGDVGGTWYWNRYPGAMCDTAAIIYMPLLEETGHMPSEKYAHGQEILEQSQKIANKYGLYDNALLHTEVTALQWQEEAGCWHVRTNRGDDFTCTFLGVGTGPFVVPKLPGIPGLESFRGHTFHTSRWDYSYTGGSPEQGGEVSERGGGTRIAAPLEKLRDKRVAIIGTGATSVQCVPHLAASAKELYVFQRTPSSVDIRGNVAIDPEWFKSIAKSGWQKEWMENFVAINTGRAGPETEDLVNDGWTELSKSINKAIRGIPRDQISPEKVMEAFEDADNQKMSKIRARCNEEVREPATAESLKAWYRQLCKRPTFHDEYLQAFNRPGVHLVDCSTARGVERITEKGLVVGGVEYEVDCIIYGSGFEVGGDMARKNGFEVTGRGGRTLTQHWAKGMRSKHGTHVHGFPNLFFQSMGQNASYVVNVPHNYVEQGKTVGAIVSHALRHGYNRVEVTKEAEDAWVAKILEAPPRRMMADCTPGYYNNEGRALDDNLKYYQGYPAGPLAYFEYLQQWRSDWSFEGIEFSTAASSMGTRNTPGVDAGARSRL